MILKCHLRRFAVLFALAGTAAVTAPGHATSANEFKVGAITIETPWSRATPGGAKVAAGYLTIGNDAATPDRLVSVTADIAGRAGIHQMSMADGMMKMRELTDGLAIPGQGSVALAPASYHLMFLDLKKPLRLLPRPWGDENRSSTSESAISVKLQTDETRGNLENTP